jgi:hypothetical protein
MERGRGTSSRYVLSGMGQGRVFSKQFNIRSVGMAKETKGIQVKPSEEESTIELWSTFGWELMNTQEVLSETAASSRLERRGDSIYSVTTPGTKTHYIKLTFQRDKSMPHYAELCDLEAQYAKVPERSRPSEPMMPKKGIGLLWWVILVLGTVMTSGVGIVITIPLYIWVRGKKKKAYDEAASSFDERVARHKEDVVAWEKEPEIRRNIIKRAKALLQ